MPPKNRQRGKAAKKAKQKKGAVTAASEPVSSSRPTVYTKKKPKKPAKKTTETVPVLYLGKEKLYELNHVLAEYQNAQTIMRKELGTGNGVDSSEEEEEETEEEETEEEEDSEVDEEDGEFADHDGCDGGENLDFNGERSEITLLSEWLGKIGFSQEIVGQAIWSSGENCFNGLRWLYNRARENYTAEPFSTPLLDNETISDMEQKRQQEAVQLQDSFGSAFVQRPEEWTLTLGNFELEVYHDAGSLYPLGPPLIILRCLDTDNGGWTKKQTLAISLAFQRFCEENIGKMAIFEGTSWLKTDAVSNAAKSIPPSLEALMVPDVDHNPFAAYSQETRILPVIRQGSPQQRAGVRNSGLPKIHQIKQGVSVNIVLKEDQSTGRQVQGLVSRILTYGNHPRGIKVQLVDGGIGRVQSIAPSKVAGASGTNTSPSPQKKEPEKKIASSKPPPPDTPKKKITPALYVPPGARSTQSPQKVNMLYVPPGARGTQYPEKRYVQPSPMVPVSNGFSTSTTTAVPQEERQLNPALDRMLYEKFIKQQQQPSYKKMQSARQALPAWSSRKEVLDAIEKHQVVVIEGDTGCGKSTQVPQFILDDFLLKRKGGQCSILVTQPRRISAIGVAQRVAAERGDILGRTVGYQIRLERCASHDLLPKIFDFIYYFLQNKMCDDTTILFATTGIVLRRLEAPRGSGQSSRESGLDGITHIIIDEVHERSLESDFLLMVMRDILRLSPSFKLILMSATLNAGLFQTYFGGDTPRIFIPGRTFPVKALYLEDALALTNYTPQGKDFVRSSRMGKQPKMPGVNGRVLTEEEMSDEMLTPIQLTTRYPRLSPAMIQSLNTIDFEKIQYPLIEILVESILDKLRINDNNAAKMGNTVEPSRGILIFLPGISEISTLHDLLSKNPRVRQMTGGGRYCIPLHGTLSSEEQLRVFERPPKGIAKIVVTTNVAETSITIDDVVFVIDTGRMKETAYDPEKGMASLVETWVSQANARQRKGRAGRVAEGTCVHLFTFHRYEKVLAPQQVPEIQRTPLEQLCLRIKILPFLRGRIASVLEKVIEPPSAVAVHDAITTLRILEALTEDEDLTALGFHLGRLPVDVRIGKLIIFGAIFDCLDPCLTIAAAMSGRSPFMSPFERRAEAQLKKNEFAKGTTPSDHFAVLKAYQEWIEVRPGGMGVERAWLHESFLSGRTFAQMASVKRQLAELLCDIGFLKGNVRARQMEWAGGKRSDGVKEAIKAAGGGSRDHNTAVIKAVLISALYPNVVKVSMRDQGGSLKLATRDGDDVSIHPGSVNGKCKKFATNYIIYHEKVKTSQIFIRDSTMVSPFALAFFGGHLLYDGINHILNIDDGWIRFSAKKEIAAVLEGSRAGLDELLAKIIETPGLDLGKTPLVEAIVGVITDEDKAMNSDFL